MLRKIFRFLFWIFFPLGLSLLLAGMMVQGGTAFQQATPTTDRLAQPTLPAIPSQADLGAQAFWMQCLPCHGDRGQGLTDEFRMTYPTEDQNCWDSGCHGKRPYENGWTIPPYVPALIGPGTLKKFPDAAVLQAYIKAVMPFQWPGTLDEETAWSLTAFLLRENGFLQPGQEVTAANAAQIRLGPVPGSPTPTPQGTPDSGNRPAVWGLGVVLLFVFGVVLVFLIRFRRLNRYN